MKTLLVISLIANLVLGYCLITRKPEKEVIERERLIIETHAEKKAPESPPMVDTRKVTQPDLPKKEKKKNSAPDFAHIENADIQDAGEKMEAERLDFLTNELGMTEEKISEHNRIRDEFFKKTANYWQKNPTGELTFKQRREMIEMEEKMFTKLEKLHGKQNWEKYRIFRENYNKKAFKRQNEDDRPYVFMGL